MKMIVQNFLLQLSSLLLGIFGGIFLAFLAAEELLQYKHKMLHFFYYFSFAALLAPVLLFFSMTPMRIIPSLIFFSVYTVLFLKAQNCNDRFQGFLYIAPLALFVASDVQNIFFVSLALCLLAIIAMTLSFFVEMPLEKMKLKELFYLLIKKYSSFILVTVLVYVFTFFLIS